jgi:uncharacterized protein (TIGR02145 family)
MKQPNKTFLLAALAMFAGACVVNMDDEKESAPVDDERVVTLSIAVPSPADSRAMSPETEGAVATVDVLLFDKTTDEFRYWAIGSDVTPDDTHPERISSFSVKLPTGTWTVVVLANARELLEASAYPEVRAAAFAGSSTLSREALLECLVVTIDAGVPWDNARVFPMWGYYKKGTETTLIVDENTADIAEAINLTRAVVRVDVVLGVDDEDEVREVFSLESVRLYNRNRAGSIAPAVSTSPGNVDGYDEEQWNGGKAIGPNVPTSPFLETGPILYDVDLDDDPATPVYTYSREIYTFEAKADATNKTCLVIGGYYKGKPSPIYYRVDFVDENEDHLSLLRNHSYHVKIKEVLAAGYASVAEAFDNKPSNIKVEITENDGTLGLIAFDEQNYLGVNTGEIILPWDAQTNKQFTISTDVANGWEITGKDGDWITLTGATSGITGVTGNVTFDASANNSGARRVGYIHARAGRLTLDVKVIQLGVGIWITDAGNVGEIQELVFHSAGGTPPAAQQVLVHWVPVGAQVHSMSIPVSGYPVFLYDPGNHVPGAAVISDPLGEMPIGIRPAAMNVAEIAADPFLEKASIVRFVAFHDDDFVPADIKVRHLNHTVIDVAAAYLLGAVSSFTVRSNTEWEISAISDPDGILDLSCSPLLDQEGGNNTTGETVNFKLVSDDTKSGKSATLTLIDPSGLAGVTYVTIYGFACGKGGNAISVRIGNNDYLTHVYGTKCWMAQNSMEGTSYSSIAFGRNAYGNPFGNFYPGDADYSGESNGYYYTWSQANTANNACPNGWRLPTDTEINGLISAANLDKTGIGKWWCGAYGESSGAFAGCYNPDGNGYWYDWGTRGLWWGAVNNRRFTGTASTLGDVNTHGTAWFSVRCVQN